MASEIKPFMLLAKLQMKSEDAAKKVSSWVASLSESTMSLTLQQDISGLQQVGKFESQQKACGSYLCVQPLEGDKTVLTVFEA